VDAFLIIVVTFAGYLVAYHTYGRFLARRIFHLNDAAPTPSRELEDGTDYVPTRKGIIFGHHYTSIAGTGPIVGPVLGVIWGWLPALLWVFVGSVVMGAVHDFGSLVVSLRNEGKSMSEVAGRYVNKRARILFFLIVFLELLIVIAVFGVVIANVFDNHPGSVLPIWCEVLIAVLLGLAVYKWKQNVALSTAVAVLAMYATVLAGHYLPVSLPSELSIGGFVLPAMGVWVLILLVYAYFASTVPVTTLLQPRDYMNAWQLFIAMGLLLAGAAATAVTAENFTIVAPAYRGSPAGAPPLLPFLFVTIACGAISGFHCLVASGTTPKQVSRESDAQFVGYGSMLMEAALAVLVIVAVVAGIGMGFDGAVGEAAWQSQYQSWDSIKKAPLAAFTHGSANMMEAIGIPHGLGLVIIGVFVASFAGTTLDTATRLQRYVISELAAELKAPVVSNRWVATAIVVVTAGILAFSAGASGAGAMKLWPMFGAVNQLLAALALLVVTVYLQRKHAWGWLLTLAPCLFMLAISVWAVVVNEWNFVSNGYWVLTVVNGGTLLLALAMVVEAMTVFLPPLFKLGAKASPRPRE
jgi:carbon starvation protein